MASASVSKGSTLTETQKSALLKLLADDDLAVYHTVRGKIISTGVEAIEWLQPHTLSNDPVLRRRVVEIIHFFARQQTDNQFLAFCLNQGEDLDIEEGAFRLARTHYPDVNIAAYQALFDSFAGELKELIDFGGGTENIIATINHYLFERRGFKGNENDYYDPENSYLNRVVDNRCGNPISLSLIYLFITRRLKLPVAGIGMPGHFLCRFQSSVEELYIDPFNRGKLLTKADCVKYLISTKGFHESDLAPISPRRMLLRMCVNLHQIYEERSFKEETARFQRYIVALAK